MINLSLFGGRRLSFVPGGEQHECGLVCLASVSEYFRGELGLTEIRQLAMHSSRAETLLEIRNLAERIGLAARGVRVGVNGLGRLSKPAILHWDMNHYVVLERTTREGIIVMDPAAGRVPVPWSQVDKSFTGVALELKPTLRWMVSSRPRRRVSLFALVGPMSRWRTDILLIVALSLLMDVLMLVTPLQMQMSIDQAIRSDDGRLVWVLGAGFGFVVLIQACVSLIRSWSATVFSTRVGFDLHDRFVRALHEKSPRFFLSHSTADILSRSRSVDSIKELVTAQLTQALLDACMSIVMVVVMFITVPWMAMVVTGFGLMNMAVTTGLRHAAVENSRRHLRVAVKADTLFMENARAARAIKLFGKEMVRTSVWRNKFVELTNLALAGGRLQMYSAQAAQLTSGLGNVALICTGTYLVLNNSITLGTMIMFFVFRAFFVERLNNCVNYLMELRRVQTHAERIDKVLSDEQGVGQVPSPSPYILAPDQVVGIEVKDVWFRYGEDGPWILQGVSFTVAPGESVAITGPSGAGKTTLMNIMLGLLIPSRGEVLINGRDLKTIAAADYAKLIGVVMQDDILFQGTVADNISFFDAPIDMQRVMDCAEKANIAGDIRAMPGQYYSFLAEAAVDISGGQKQRLFIARAIYHDPKLLFLDEATSHLDAASENLVSQAVKAMKMTRVLIAHRKETIATADRVLVITSVGTMAAREDGPSLRLHSDYSR